MASRFLLVLYCWALVIGDVSAADSFLKNEGGFDLSALEWAPSNGEALPEKVYSRIGATHLLHEAAVVFSPDGSILASTWRGRICLWETSGGKKTCDLGVDDEDIWSLAFSPDGRLIVSGSQGGFIDIWNIRTRVRARRLSRKGSGVGCITFSPSGKTFASAGDDKFIRLWEIATGQEISRLSTDIDRVKAVAFSRDGKILAADGGEGTVNLWSVETRKVFARLRIAYNRAVYFGPLAFSPDGRMLVAAGDTGLHAWEIPAGKPLKIVNSHKTGVEGICFSPDGRSLACGDWCGTIWVWRVDTGQVVRRLVAHARDAKVRVVFSPNGNVLASWAPESGARIRLWTIATGEEQFPVAGHNAAIASLAFTPDGKTIVSGDVNQKIFLNQIVNHSKFCLHDGERFGSNPIAVLPLTGTIAIGVDDSIHFYRAKDSANFQTLGSLQSKVRQIASAADESILALSGTDYHIHLYDLRTLDEVAQCEHKGLVLSFAFSSDSKMLASATALETSLRLWQVPSGKEMQPVRLDASGLRSVTFSPDGRTLAVLDRELAVHICRLSQHGTFTQVGILEGRFFGPLVFSTDGRTLALLRERIHLLEVSSGKQRCDFESLDGSVTSFAFSPDGNTLAAGFSSGSILLWDVPRSNGATAGLTSDNEEQFEACWKALADDNASVAYRAMCQLKATSLHGVAFLKRRVKRVLAPDTRLVQVLISELASSEFDKRKHASSELEKFGDVIQPALEEAARSKVSAETRARARKLLDNLAWPQRSRESLRALRAIEVLEGIRSSEAVSLIQDLASGAPEAQVTVEAKATLQRLERSRLSGKK